LINQCQLRRGIEILCELLLLNLIEAKFSLISEIAFQESETIDINQVDLEFLTLPNEHLLEYHQNEKSNPILYRNKSTSQKFHPNLQNENLQ
jgi:hypothetical protein